MKLNQYPLWLGYMDMPEFLESPVNMCQGYDAVLVDTNGKQYVDLVSGIRNVLLGYSQQFIIDAVTSQMQRLPFARGSSFGNDIALELAQRLADMAPVKNPRLLFHSSGSEAVEAAIKLVRQLAFLRQDGRTSIITLGQAYHGQTITALSASGEHYSKEPFAPLNEGFVFIDVPKRVGDVEILENVLLENPHVGAVIVEPILVNGGVISLPDGYLAKLRRICDSHGALLICDEISTGLGRCGKWFLSDECKPDILVAGKVLTNGYLPLSAVIVADNVWQVFDQQGIFRHGQTNLNHPVCCAAALATIDLLEKYNAPELCLRKGDEVRHSLEFLVKQGKVTEIRGRGLLLAIIFDPKINNKHSSKKWLQIAMLDSGYILGQIDNMLFLAPPVIIHQAQIDGFAKEFEKLLE